MDDSEPSSQAERLHLLSRDELEDRVRQRTTELENVMDAMVDVLIRLDEQGDISLINGSVEDVLGYEVEELVGQPVDVLLADPPSSSQSPVSSTGQLLEILLAEGKVTDMEVYCSTVDGETVPMSLSASILEDENGMPDGIVCVATDITDRKEAEERAEFLHSLLRHDLGNNLQVAYGFLDTLSDTDLDDTQQEYIERSRDAVDDAVSLIDDIRTLNRIDGSESLTQVGVETTVSEALERHEGLRAQVGITVETDLDDVRVLAGSLVREVFANLVENALVHSNADSLRITTEVDPDTVTVTLEDDGDGVPPVDRPDIFERGYSVGGSSGSGLGMYIVAELTENYGGDVAVGESDLGGARFDVTFQRPDG